jgi:protein-S-isoprenylcysteine O-methyltransferase Ste14
MGAVVGALCGAVFGLRADEALWFTLLWALIYAVVFPFFFVVAFHMRERRLRRRGDGQDVP